MTTENFNPNALPYKIEVTRAEYNVPPVPMLHNLMCDLAKKIPEIRFQTNGIQRWHGDNINKGDDYYVYAGTEKVGNIWRSVEYRNGKNIEVFNLSSERITVGRKGRQHSKTTKHYKVALKIGLEAFAPFEMKEIASKILETVDNIVTRVQSRAGTQLTWALQNRLVDLGDYAANVIDNGPQPVPTELVNNLPNGWREKLNNFKVALSVQMDCKAMNGIGLKLMQDGTFVAVDFRDKSIVAQSSNPYDLPMQYQDKFAILKMMEKDQPVANVGIKSEDHDAMFFYLVGGDLLAKETPTA